MQIYENNTHLMGIGCKNFYELNTTVFCIFVEIAFVICRIEKSFDKVGYNLGTAVLKPH